MVLDFSIGAAATAEWSVARKSSRLLVAQGVELDAEHLDGIVTRFLLGDQPAVNGMSDREVEVRLLILRKEQPSWALMKAVDTIREFVRIDLAGAPSSELSLELRELSGELTFVCHSAELAEPPALRFRDLTVGRHYLGSELAALLNRH